jgi:long-chain fatty acid transport protein
VGANYQVTDDTSLGAYWQTKKAFTFDDAVLLPGGAVHDVHFEHPRTLGLGLANSSLAEGRLLLAADVLYINHDSADFLKAIYHDQWVMQLGSQYAVNSRLRLRSGYAYNQNPMREATVTSIGRVDLPDGVPALRYIQGQFAAIPQHRVTVGIGMRDALPGLDFDLFAGGMFRNTEQFGSTIASVESYWIGMGMTWRFGRGAAESGPWTYE